MKTKKKALPGAPSSRAEREKWNFQICETKGSLREAGYAYGSFHRYHYRACCMHFLRFHSRSAQEEAYKRGLKRAENVARLFPDVMDELKGRAKGAEIPFADMLQLHFGDCEVGQFDHCSGIALRGGSPGAVLAGTLDGMGLIVPLLHVVIPRGRSHLSYISLPSAGINSEGLAIGVAGSNIRRTPEKLRKRIAKKAMSPYPLEKTVPNSLSRLLLLRNCRSTDEAIEFLSKPFIHYLGNVIIADSGGNVAVVERDGHWYHVVAPEDDAAWGVNFFAGATRMDLPRTKYLQKQEPHTFARQYQRYGVYKRYAREYRGTYSITSLKSLLRSHTGAGPDVPCGSLCAVSTDMSFIEVPGEGRVLVAVGHACQASFREIRLP
jgi:hypothetical protein